MAWPMRGLIVLTLSLHVGLGILPPGLNILDVRPWYSGAEAESYFEALGALGRAQYVAHQWVDVFFMGTYTLLFTLLCRRYHAPSWLRRMAFAPGIADALETFGILAVLGAYPQVSHGAYVALGVFSALKWLAFAAFVLGCGRVAWRRKRAPGI